MPKDYSAVLLDGEGFEIARDEGLPSIKQAKDRARHLMSAVFAEAAETSHGELGSHKVEVRDAAGVCEWDAFL